MTELEEYAQRIESLAQRQGLDYYPVDFELAPQSLMTEIAVYGLPVRMPHWSFGVRYIHQLVRQSMGHSKIFEVMFPGDPCRAFLMDSNSLAENALVTAHVVGHADFSKNNQLFARFHDMAGGNIVEKHALASARQVMKEEDDFGFIRNYLDRDLAEQLDFFVYEVHQGDEIRVQTRDLEAVRESILAPKFNFGAPRVAAVEIKSDGGLILAHEHSSDGRGLDAARAKKVLE
jgi:spore cortex formation protein SpoVR/YcgB (stage V sporulation)